MVIETFRIKTGRSGVRKIGRVRIEVCMWHGSVGNNFGALRKR